MNITKEIKDALVDILRPSIEEIVKKVIEKKSEVLDEDTSTFWQTQLKAALHKTSLEAQRPLLELVTPSQCKQLLMPRDPHLVAAMRPFQSEYKCINFTHAHQFLDMLKDNPILELSWGLKRKWYTWAELGIQMCKEMVFGYNIERHFYVRIREAKKEVVLINKDTYVWGKTAWVWNTVVGCATQKVLYGYNPYATHYRFAATSSWEYEYASYEKPF